MGNYEGSGSGGTFVILEEMDGYFTPLLISGGAAGHIQGYNQRNPFPWINGNKDENGHKSDLISEENKEIGSFGKPANEFSYNGAAGFHKSPEGEWQSTKQSPKHFKGYNFTIKVKKVV